MKGKRKIAALLLTGCLLFAAAPVTFAAQAQTAGIIQLQASADEGEKQESRMNFRDMRWQSWVLIAVGAGCAILRFSRGKKRREEMYDEMEQKGKK